MFKAYIRYIKDNPNHYWFRAKLFGWGWMPATWEGWLVLIIFIASVLLNGMRIDEKSHSVSDTLINFIPQTIILAAVLITICWKTGERPRWQWGISDKYTTNTYDGGVKNKKE